jgi:hypothetical protein
MEARAQLGQLRPANTTAASIYTPGTGRRGVITSLIVCNVTAGAVTFRVFHDDNGTTYDETSALVFDVALPAATTIELGTNVAAGWAVAPTGNFAVRTSSASAINFTAYGYEILS